MSSEKSPEALLRLAMIPGDVDDTKGWLEKLTARVLEMHFERVRLAVAVRLANHAKEGTFLPPNYNPRTHRRLELLSTADVEAPADIFLDEAYEPDNDAILHFRIGTRWFEAYVYTREIAPPACAVGPKETT